MFTHSEKIGALGEALAKAQAEVEGASKDSANPHFRSKYASLAAVIDACRAALSKNSIAVVQAPSAKGSEVTVSTILMHASGEWIEASLTASARDASPQSVGSAVTYLRRYGLMSMVGIAPEDDDGNEAQVFPSGRFEPPTPPRVQERTTPQERPKAPAAPAPGIDAFAEVVELLQRVFPGDEGRADRLSWFWDRFKTGRDAVMPEGWNPAKAFNASDEKRKAKVLETAKALVESETHPEDRR